MTFKAKPFKLGNSVAIYFPKEVYTNLTLGEEIEVQVYTKQGEKEKEDTPVYTKPLNEHKSKKLTMDMITGTWIWK